MPANVEIKARIDSVEALLPLARALSDDDHPQLIHQDDTFFDVPHGRLKLRVFGDGSGELIHDHRANANGDGPTRSDYILAPAPPAWPPPAPAATGRPCATIPPMPANVEIKARIDSVEALLPLARALSDGDPPQLIHQDDSFFDAPHGRLKLRVFGDGSGELIHYHRSDEDGPKRSDYVLAPAPEPESLRAALTRAMGLLGRVRKDRILLLVGPTRIHLDRVEGLGDFLELEVMLQGDQTEAEGTAIAHDLMARLQIAPSQLVSGAYLDLLRSAAATAADATNALAPPTPG